MTAPKGGAVSFAGGLGGPAAQAPPPAAPVADAAAHRAQVMAGLQEWQRQANEATQAALSARAELEAYKAQMAPHAPVLDLLSKLRTPEPEVEVIDPIRQVQTEVEKQIAMLRAEQEMGSRALANTLSAGHMQTATAYIDRLPIVPVLRDMLRKTVAERITSMPLHGKDGRPGLAEATSEQVIDFVQKTAAPVMVDLQTQILDQARTPAPITPTLGIPGMPAGPEVKLNPRMGFRDLVKQARAQGIQLR